MKKLIYIVVGIIVLIIVIVIINNRGEEKVELEQESESKLQEQIQPEITDYDIQFTAEHISNRTFKVNGITDLPDGAKIHVTIYDEDYFKHDEADSEWRFENLSYFSDSAIVRNGEFNKTLTASEMETPLKSDKYEVEVSFNPRAQTSNIKNIVGKNGVYLSGKLLDTEIEGLIIIKTIQLVSLKKEIPYKIIDEEDISYAGCKRVGIRIIVPDDVNKTDVSYILKKIIDNNKSKWNDITVWAYKYSEGQQVGQIPYTMGMEEYSICEQE